ncbi:DUF1513 domain-containing protein [Leisingera aquaemixtae]|uniref:Twin-arginine translocation pathway signal n=1 Tax=Leisingera aquaemixtae TaxID=1396826 RepID=A0A0P1H561_9RHOB|nr:DUF1513 domain-containing protein [Leisingera aquaemixtae]CUH98023.1 hypothetical protein PHA8399_00128 [Leisingera aquaemixtae]
MTTRRGFLAGLMASTLTSQASWASAGSPAFLSAGKDASGAFLLAGLSDTGGILFRHPLPGRGHAAAAHPVRPEAVAFARRPDRFADVIDCRSGAATARLEPPAGHHFYGHGTFSPDGSRLFTTENDYENARGVIGVWDATGGYRRITAFSSGGIGPHDMALRRDAPGLVVANGGIETHPDSGRAKLNLPDMRPNLSYLSLEGELQAQMELAQELRLNSIRHLAVRADGTVGFAMQWQGDPGEQLPAAGLHRPGTAPRLMAEDDARVLNLKGYGGSVAFSADGSRIGVTSPRGGVLQVMDTVSGALLREFRMHDVCGLAASAGGFTASTGNGQFFAVSDAGQHPLHRADLAWDNHLIPLI